jgi:hypothetical protein
MDNLDRYYKELTITDSDFPVTPQVDTQIRGTAFMLIIDEGEAVEFSMNNGHTLHGKIIYEDRSLTFDGYDAQKIWFRKVGTTDCKIRVFTWVKQR